MFVMGGWEDDAHSDNTDLLVGEPNGIYYVRIFFGLVFRHDIFLR